MKKKYAKLFLKNWINNSDGKYSEKTYNRKLNWAIVNQSHKIYYVHGLRGHNIRQKIRKELWSYCNMELKNHPPSYRPSMLSRIKSFIKRLIQSRKKLK